MSAAQYSFKENDLVWAKMKGYPYWPSKIMKPPKKHKPPANKIFVFFYGTHEHAWMAPADLLPYMEFREKFKKPSARKGFLEAVWEIEEDPSLAISSSVVTPKKKRKKIKKEAEECNFSTSESLSLPAVSCAIQDTPQSSTNIQTSDERDCTTDESGLVGSQPTSIPSSLDEGSQEEPLSIKKSHKRPARSQTTTPVSGKRRLTRQSQRLKSEEEEKDEISESNSSLGENTRSAKRVKTEQFNDIETVSKIVDSKSNLTSVELSQESGMVKHTDECVPTLLDYTTDEPSIHIHVKTEPVEVDGSELPEQQPHIQTYPSENIDSAQSQQQAQLTDEVIVSPTKRYSTRTRCNPTGGSIVEKLTQNYSARKEIVPLSSPKHESITQQHFEQLELKKSPKKKIKQTPSKPIPSPKRATRTKAAGKMQGGKSKLITPATGQRMTRSRLRKTSNTQSDVDGSTEVNQSQISLEGVSEDTSTESCPKTATIESDVELRETRENDIHSCKIDVDLQPVEEKKRDSEDQEAKEKSVSIKEAMIDDKQQLSNVQDDDEHDQLETTKQPVVEKAKKEIDKSLTDEPTTHTMPVQTCTFQSTDASTSTPSVDMSMTVSISLEIKDRSKKSTESVESDVAPLKNPSTESQLDSRDQSDQNQDSKSQEVSSVSDVISEEHKHLKASSDSEKNRGTRTSNRKKRLPSQTAMTTSSKAQSHPQTTTSGDDKLSGDKTVTLDNDASIKTESIDGPNQNIAKKSTESSKHEVTTDTQRRQLRSNKRFAKSQSPCSPQKRMKIDEQSSLSDMEQPHSSSVEGSITVKPLQSPQKKVGKKSVRLKNVGGGPFSKSSGGSKRKGTSSKTMEGVSPSKKLQQTSSGGVERAMDADSKTSISETVSVTRDSVEEPSNNVSKKPDDTMNVETKTSHEKQTGHGSHASNKESTLCSPDVPKSDKKNFEPEKQGKVFKDETAALPVERQHEPIEASSATEESTHIPLIKQQDTEKNATKSPIKSQPSESEVSTRLEPQQVDFTNIGSAAANLMKGADSSEKNKAEDANKATLQSGGETTETKDKPTTNSSKKDQDESRPRDPPPILKIRPGMTTIQILQAFNYNLKASLTLDAPNVQQALVILRDILDIQCSTNELEKVPDFVHTIRKLRHYAPSSKVMKKAEEVYIKLKALYMKPAQQKTVSVGQKRGAVGVTGFRKRPPTMMEWIQSQNNKLSRSEPAQPHTSTPTTTSTSKTGISDIVSKKPTQQEVMLANAPVVPEKQQDDVQHKGYIPEQRVDESAVLLSSTTKLDQSKPKPDPVEPLAAILNQVGPSATNADTTKSKHEPSATSSQSTNGAIVRRSTRGSSRKTAKVNYSEMMESEVTATSESEDDQMVPA